MTIPLQPVSLEIWDKKYRLKDREGNPVDKDINDTFKRVAMSLALTEKDSDYWYEKFLWALENGAIPAGRITSNIGAGKYKPATSTINCTVSGTIEDSMDDILTKLHEAGLTLKAGCGIGYEFSTLRPKNSFVQGAGATTSGPLSFMDIYDKMCFTVSSAGGRRGAQMCTFDVQHPDVFEFIKAKREDGRLRQFNLSLLITDAFIEAVKKDEDFPLVFPVTKNAERDGDQCIWRNWSDSDDYVKNAEGEVLCKIYETVKARDLWDAIMESTYDFAEPGFILIDRVNEMNNNWFCEDIRATNPCGEQPLPPYGSCLLGSINLVHFVDNPFTEKASFNYVKYRIVIDIFTRMLDNVVELNGLPLSEQEKEIFRKRRHGMGFLGLGSAMTMLRIPYGSPESIRFTEEVSKVLTVEGYKTGIELAVEKGPAPIMEEQFRIDANPSKRFQSTVSAMRTAGAVKDKDTTISGRVLWTQSKFMNNVWKEVDDNTRLSAWNYGCRFTHHSSIAPTGTIALSLGNNVSNGIEPSFGHQYSRNIIISGKKTKKKSDVFSYELLLYRHLVDPTATAYNGKLPEYFSTAETVTPMQHVAVQAAAQKWIDSSISKTANVPTDFPFEEFKDIYMYAHEAGLKGCTTFRFNPEAFQGVLVQDSDLKKTFYEFTDLEGNVIKCSGEEEIFFDGETHTAANLYDAMKEGYYGKF
jgi:ribonucleoside-diphosphate reductase alpha chain